jgi:ribosomal protein S18 acetylase RimI-like enzyme
MDWVLHKNLNNLNLFWQALNAEEQDGLFTHTFWPNKQWFADFSLPSGIALPAGKTFITIAELNSGKLSGYAVKGQLVVMNLSLKNNAKKQQPVNYTSQKIIKLTSEESATIWATSCGLAFGYEIDHNVIQKLLNDPKASVLSYIINDQIVATAISYKSGDTLGIHQLGTVPGFRKMGVAAALMEHLIIQAQYDDIDYVSLQASKAGLHLYEKMGFQELTKITSLVAAE